MELASQTDAYLRKCPDEDRSSGKRETMIVPSSAEVSGKVYRPGHPRSPMYIHDWLY
jgi:hypothetical protein